MAFRINEFKSQMDHFGGLARGSLFSIQIMPPAGVRSRANSRDLTFFCKNASIPGMTINAAQNDQVGQFRKMMPQSIQIEPVQAIFMLDSDHQVLSFFHSWMQQIVNYGSSAGTFAEVGGKLPFEVGYKDEYSCRVVIRQYSTNYQKSGQYYEVILDNAFPIAVGDVDLAWESADSYSVLPVSFQYDRIEVTGEQIGSPTARFGRGNGVLDLFNAVGSFGQLVGQNFIPKTVQEAVDKYTRVRNVVDRI